MCGDYNVDLLKINNVQFNENYSDSIISSGYVPTITLPTRLSDNSSLIDNVFTSNLSNALSAYILNVHITGFVRCLTKFYKVLYLFLKNKTSYKVLYFIEGIFF